MSSILIVDDEPDYREELKTALSRAGHTIATAASGREAIDFGMYWRPDVLIADWMLKGEIHGLQVAEVLHLIHPGLQAIMITGYETEDLHEQAERLHVVDFIEKPFGWKRIQAAIDRARSNPSPPASSLLAVIETDHEHGVTYMNPKARELLGTTRISSEITNLGQIWHDNTVLQRLEDSVTRWVDMPAPTKLPTQWLVRTRPNASAGRNLVMLLTEERGKLQHYPLIHMLLGENLEMTGYRPRPGQVLVLDGENMIRRVWISAFDRIGSACHTAHNTTEALKLLQAAPDIAIIFIDRDVCGDKAEAFLDDLRIRHPRKKIVGTSALNDQAEFARMGVPLFLAKPFRVEDLLQLLERHAAEPS